MGVLAGLTSAAKRVPVRRRVLRLTLPDRTNGGDVGAPTGTRRLERLQPAPLQPLGRETLSQDFLEAEISNPVIGKTSLEVQLGSDEGLKKWQRVLVRHALPYLRPLLEQWLFAVVDALRESSLLPEIHAALLKEAIRLVLDELEAEFSAQDFSVQKTRPPLERGPGPPV